MKGILRLLQRKNLLFKSFWLSVPSLFFVLLLWQFTWMTSSQRSSILQLLEKKYFGGLFISLVLLYALVTWYSGRLLVYGKHAFSVSLYRHFKKQEFRSGRKRKNAAFYLQLIFSLPRVCAFLVFSIAWIFILLYAPLNINRDSALNSPYTGYLLFLATILLYSLLYRLAFLVRQKLIEKSYGMYIADEERRKRKNIILISYLLLIFLVIAGNTFIRNDWLLLFSIVLVQLFFPFIVIIRRAYSDLTQTWYDHWVNNMKRKSTDSDEIKKTWIL